MGLEHENGSTKVVINTSFSIFYKNRNLVAIGMKLV